MQAHNIFLETLHAFLASNWARTPSPYSLFAHHRFIMAVKKRPAAKTVVKQKPAAKAMKKPAAKTMVKQKPAAKAMKKPEPSEEIYDLLRAIEGRLDGLDVYERRAMRLMIEHTVPWQRSQMARELVIRLLPPGAMIFEDHPVWDYIDESFLR
jgi:hypothetical protein